jgi:hypothetical protein
VKKLASGDVNFFYRKSTEPKEKVLYIDIYSRGKNISEIWRVSEILIDYLKSASKT